MTELELELEPEPELDPELMALADQLILRFGTLPNPWQEPRRWAALKQLYKYIRSTECNS